MYSKWFHVPCNGPIKWNQLKLIFARRPNIPLLWIVLILRIFLLYHNLVKIKYYCNYYIITFLQLRLFLQYAATLTNTIVSTVLPRWDGLLPGWGDGLPHCQHPASWPNACDDWRAGQPLQPSLPTCPHRQDDWPNRLLSAIRESFPERNLFPHLCFLLNF